MGLIYSWPLTYFAEYTISTFKRSSIDPQQNSSVDLKMGKFFLYLRDRIRGH